MGKDTARGVALLVLWLAATVVISQMLAGIGTAGLTLVGGILGLLLGLPGLMLILDGHGRR